MVKEIEIDVYPDKLKDYALHKKLIAKKLRLNPTEIKSFKVERRSIDARKKRVVYKLRGYAFINESRKDEIINIVFKPVENNKKVIVVGSGPAGLFAALKLIELGVKPIVLERGKDVQTRRRDIRDLMQNGTVNPDSNYCFGEGGAGTYSDGKLYTRSKKRGDVNAILNLLVHHGAHEDILIDAHPHIGSNKLPKVVENIRNTIINNNGELHFNSRVTDLILRSGKIVSVIINDGEEIIGDAVILATGHSARDIFYLLNRHNIKIEQKPFAMGVRIEHPQPLIDKIQYHSEVRHPNLPASTYSLNCQVDNRGVYSFCMCPGGIIVPASTEPGELVLNGMSVSRRDSPFANSGLVVEVNENDWKKYKNRGVFAGLELQKEFETRAFIEGGKTQRAPAQRITDFVDGKFSSSLPDTSYVPGTVSSSLQEVLPKQISARLKKSLLYFGRKMEGFYTEEAQMLAAETRTSSPIRIPRDKDTLMHVEIEGLFPAGEGAGYAGGIVSAAIDGEKCAEAVMKFIRKN